MNKNHDIGSLLPKKIINLTFILFMRVFILVLYLGLTSIYANVAKAQNEISVKVQGVSLQTLFSTIQQKSDYVFFYNEDKLPKDKITINVKNASISEVLSKYFTTVGIDYRIVDKNITLKSKVENSAGVKTKL